MSALQLFAQATTDFTTDYTTTTTGSNPAVNTVLVIMYIVLIVLAVVGMWKLFTKAGRPGWAAIVPFYNVWVLSEIAGRPGWFGLLAALVSVIPFVGWIISVVMFLFISLDLAAKFGKSKLFGVVGLWLFSLIGYLILGFGSAKYDASRPTDTPQFGSPTAPSNQQTPPASTPPSSPTPPANPTV